ncbi:hypothetical protein DICPUDRAFT_157612 [Dictyostelium purpureum]|uniref:Uncharacterized protein n=1 Tax=Dictyostelium purpureum TaxID=5786 RepID=F0ZZL0_DICPU|nr:uncharacterized protein DICPUDRAFT_157612 [Dictyostelium purpureum]EGC30612.1 hypothetical protein DICPUDRAFT_157612 [Dictyostelium purpureum]|eukprot:XP_003292847.1 hypothetical protein DICPUDRAFT_157612 [Dictyostelium purpureum]
MLFKSLQSITQTQNRQESTSSTFSSTSKQSFNTVALLDNNNVGILNNNSHNNILGVLSQQTM